MPAVAARTALGDIVKSPTGPHRAAAASALTAKTTLNRQNVSPRTSGEEAEWA